MGPGQHRCGICFLAAALEGQKRSEVLVRIRGAQQPHLHTNTNTTQHNTAPGQPGTTQDPARHGQTNKSANTPSTPNPIHIHHNFTQVTSHHHQVTFTGPTVHGFPIRSPYIRPNTSYLQPSRGSAGRASRCGVRGRARMRPIQSARACGVGYPRARCRR